MAYAEKLVKSWRACYQGPGGPGDIIKTSGFPSEPKALKYGRDQEAAVRAGRWLDPRRGDMLFGEFAAEWYGALDLELTSMETYQYVLEHHLLPAWGEWKMSALSTAGLRIKKWLADLSRDGFSQNTIALVSGRMSSILADAVVEGIVSSNPMARTSGRRGKVAERKAASQTPPPVWVSPYQALLIAERAALRTRRDEDFVRIITLAWTGVRWAESAGLETAYLYGDKLDVEHQLRVTRQGYARKAPKDGGKRRIDVPPFLEELLETVVAMDGRPEAAEEWCECRGSLPEEYAHPKGVHVFTGPRGTPHWTRNAFADRALTPAATGRIEPERARERAVMMVDGDDDPMGVPKGRGQAGASCWAPIAPGLTLHGLRHSHATWMDTAGVPVALRKERLGHTDSSVHAGYTHIAQESRDHLNAVLTDLWMSALAERAAMSPASSVPLLKMLLGRDEQDHPQNHSRSTPDRPRPARRKNRRGLRIVA